MKHEQERRSRIIIFFHPDCTVGFGIAPNHALRLVGCTTDRELHPALKIVIYLCEVIIPLLSYVFKVFLYLFQIYSDNNSHEIIINVNNFSFLLQIYITMFQ